MIEKLIFAFSGHTYDYSNKQHKNTYIEENRANWISSIREHS